MKKLLVTLSIIAFTASTAWAQTPPGLQDNTTVNVSASVQAAITVETLQDVRFGDLSTDHNVAELNEDGVTNEQLNVGADHQYGQIRIKAINSEQVRIKLPATVVTLTDQTTSLTPNDLLFTPKVFDGSTVLAETGTVINSQPEGEGIHTMSGTSGRTEDDLSVGGTLVRDGSGNFEQGIYSGSFTIDVEYENI